MLLKVSAQLLSHFFLTLAYIIKSLTISFDYLISYNDYGAKAIEIKKPQSYYIKLVFNI